MVKSVAPLAASAALLFAAASAASVPDGTWPTSTGTVQYTEAYTVKAGETFDGKMQTFERSDVSCEGQTESGSSTAVFLVEAGGTLKNAIIGKNQMEGVHCDDNDCTIDNVWWDDVCEDALSIKGGSASSVSTVTGGGARSADDKVIQHNGLGTVKIDGFYGEDISKLYRSCGTCGDKQRTVSVSNVYVVNPGNAIVTVNKNYNDQATLSNIWVKSSSDKVKICQWSQGNADGEPTMLGDGPSGTLCQYAESDVHINGEVSQATSTSSGSSNATETASSASSSTQQASSASASTSTEPSSSSSTAESTSSTGSATDDSSAAGTVAPAADSGSFEQSVVNFASSESTEQQATDESSDVSQTAMSQSSVASSTAASTSTGGDSEAQTEESSVESSSTGSTAAQSTAANTDSSSVSSTTQSTASSGATQSTTASTAGSDGATSQTSSSNSTGSLPDGTWPTSTGTVTYTEPYTIKAGEVFDGKMQTFERSDITCSEGEGQKDTAVFLVEAGGTLKNAIIGKNQKEGVHCDDHDCTIENVWWDDVCEDALSIKGGSASSVTTVTNCGARYASDKVVQHNGQGTVKINGFYAQEFGKLYRSCGTCGDIPRIVTVDNVYAVDPLVSVITVNKNYGDQATLRNIHVKTSDGSSDVKVCQWSQGGSSPSNLGDGPSGSLCDYSESDVFINQ